MNASASYYHQQEFRRNSNSDQWVENVRSDKNRLLDEMKEGKKIKDINIGKERRKKAVESMTPEEKAEYEFLCDRNKNHRTVSKERFLYLMQKNLKKK